MRPAADVIDLPAEPAPPPDAGSFEEVYGAHFQDLTVQLYAYFGDRQEAQDVVPEAFCRALVRWSNVVRYDDPVARALARSRVRRRLGGPAARSARPSPPDGSAGLGG